MSAIYTRRRAILAAQMKQIEPAAYAGGPITVEVKPEKRKPGRPKKIK